MTQQVPVGGSVIVGGSFSVGEYTGALGDELAELGAVMQQQRGRRNPRIDVLMTSVNSRVAALEAAARQNTKLKPLLKMAIGARNVSQAALNAAAVDRVKSTRNYLEMPTHVIPVNFDGVAAGQVSGVATITAPHQQPWRLIGILTNDAQCNGIRVISLKLANTEHVVASNVAFSSAGPSQPGIDAAVFSGKLHKGLLPSFQYRPWGLGRGGWLRSDASLILQVYNPGAAAASLNVSVLVQSTPCGEGVGYSKDGVYPSGSQTDKRMWMRLRKGLLNLWPRA